MINDTTHAKCHFAVTPETAHTMFALRTGVRQAVKLREYVVAIVSATGIGGFPGDISIHPEFEPLDLAGRSAGEVVDEVDDVRVLISEQGLFAPFLELSDEVVSGLVAVGEDD